MYSPPWRAMRRATEATTPPRNFTVNNSGPDTTAPTVSLTAPASGATVSGSVTVSANASDNVGVVGVQFRLDGNNLGAEDTAAPYSTSWNTTGASNGSHSLTAVARDAAGNLRTSTARTITVSNLETIPPTIAMTAPAAGSTVSGIVAVGADASDNVGVVGVQFSVDGNNLGAEDTSAPYTASWDTTAFVNGSHSVTGVARDAAGNLDHCRRSHGDGQQCRCDGAHGSHDGTGKRRQRFGNRDGQRERQ